MGGGVGWGKEMVMSSCRWDWESEDAKDILAADPRMMTVASRECGRQVCLLIGKTRRAPASHHY